MRVVGWVSLLVVWITQTSMAQTINQNFSGGNQGFAELLASGLVYPQSAIDSCEMGSLKVEVTLGADGKLSAVDLLNSLGATIDEQVVSFLNDTDGLWVGSDGEKIPFSIAFKISYEESAIEGDFSVIGHHFNGAKKICGTNLQHEAAFKSALKSGDFDKAKHEVMILQRRNPDSVVYQQFSSLVQ